MLHLSVSHLYVQFGVFHLDNTDDSNLQAQFHVRKIITRRTISHESEFNVSIKIFYGKRSLCSCASFQYLYLKHKYVRKLFTMKFG